MPLFLKICCPRPLRFCAGILLLLFSFFMARQDAFAAPEVHPASTIGVCSAIVYDLDHEAILFEQNADESIPPASLTKVLSLFLALDHIAKGNARPDTPVAISQAAAATGGSRMGLRPNERVPLEQLLMGMAVSSGNDASHAVAEFVAGSASAFVNMMNVKARQIGMADSFFLNPHGLPATGQRTTARDMLTLARAYLQSHPDALKLHNMRLLRHGGRTTWNKNPLLGQYPGADGLKTGWVRASGYNLIFTASRGGRRLLAVILGAPDMTARGAAAWRLLDAGFLVLQNRAVSVTAALDTLPEDVAQLDVQKTAREAGLLKAKRGYAINGKSRRMSLAAKSGRSRISIARTASARRSEAASAQIRATQADKAAAGARAAKRKPSVQKPEIGNKDHAARSARLRGRSG